MRALKSLGSQAGFKLITPYNDRINAITHKSSFCCSRAAEIRNINSPGCPFKIAYIKYKQTAGACFKYNDDPEYNFHFHNHPLGSG